MRGLTPMERAELVSLLDTRPESRIEGDLTPAERALIELGRAAVDSTLDDEWELTVATDLGRLALRVCPVDES